MAYIDAGPNGAGDGEFGGSRASRERGHGFGAILRWSFSGLLIAGLGFTIWQAYADRYAGGEPSVVPIILAEEGPMKVEPREPGGASVPYQELSIYELLESADDAPASETDRGAADGDGSAGQPRATEPATEAPDAAEDGPPGQVAPGDGTNVAEAGDGAAEERETGAAADAAARAESGTEDEAYEPPPRREYRTMAEAIGPYRIQFGAFRTPEAAYDRWIDLSRRNRDLLRNLDLIIERADQGNSGIVYRLQAGPLRTPEEVRGLCEQLRRRQISCVLVEV